MANLVVEDQDGRVGNERSGWSLRRREGLESLLRTEKCIKASRNMFSVLERYTNSEARTIARTVTE